MSLLLFFNQRAGQATEEVLVVLGLFDGMATLIPIYETAHLTHDDTRVQNINSESVSLLFADDGETPLGHGLSGPELLVKENISIMTTESKETHVSQN